MKLINNFVSFKVYINNKNSSLATFYGLNNYENSYLNTIRGLGPFYPFL